MNVDQIKRKSEETFDEITRTGRIIEEPTKCYDIVLEMIKTNIGAILDVGCGEGVMLEKIRGSNSNCHLCGIDLSGEAIRKASLSRGDTIEFKKGDAEKLPYNEGTFDLVICMHSFHHYPHPHIALKVEAKGIIICCGERS